ncbi:50S ribosomal protein L21 [Limnochorda pilosa]|uniref:Large ribosomal subunit protein bL21 n=1 Tax=Limnochorda pilosa TaxID=1555112 RepID=A0A0K2SP59_LIMPI|nr:50S ribosomal protein L21 [Limnochorda pilosa]BAS28609.1 50S ribosomal protein L21 [Limnochorda pilosa]
MYAVVETGGKQYRVQEGDSLVVERLDAPADGEVALERVLLVADGETCKVGTPVVDGARVVARVEKHLRGPKVTVFTYKAKKNQHRKLGHRQELTRLRIEKIEG